MTRLRRRLASAGQDGSALLLSLAVAVTLVILVTAMSQYVSQNSHDAATSSAQTSALSVAEAALNTAASILESSTVDASSSSALPTSSSPSTAATATGTASWWGSYNSSTRIWTVTGMGTVYDPATKATVSKTVSEQFSVANSLAWQYIYMDNSNGCLNLANSVIVTEPLFDRGNVCMSNSARIDASAGTVYVGGTIQTTSSSSVGQSGAPLANLHVAGGCRYGTSGAYTTPCGAAQQVYATNQDTVIPSGTTKPTITLSSWYANANPGPKHACTTGSFPGGFDNDSTLNTSLPSGIDLEPATAYSCVVTSGGQTIGQLSWTPGNPGTLTIKGTIYFDGNLTMTGSQKGVYSGQGTIYASGTITFGNSEQLCGAYASGQCDWTHWNPSVNMLALVAGSTSTTPDFTTTQSSMFQGGIYASTDYSQGNSVKQQGPIIANNITLAASSQAGYPPNMVAPPGAPGGLIVSPIAGTWKSN